MHGNDPPSLCRFHIRGCVRDKEDTREDRGQGTGDRGQRTADREGCVTSHDFHLTGLSYLGQTLLLQMVVDNYMAKEEIGC